MKKLVLVAATALTCSGVVCAQSSTVSVYARVDNGVRTFSGHAGGQSADLYHSALGGSRWGLNGHHDLGNGMKAGAVLEGTIASDTGGTASINGYERVFDRQSFVYLSEEKWGTVKLGRDNTFGLDALFSGALDVAGLLDAAKTNAVIGSAYGPNPLTSMYSTTRGTRRLDNVVKYTNTKGDFNYGLAYAFGDTNGDVKAGSTQNAILGYKKDKLTTVTTYQITNDPSNKKMDIWNIGGRYNFGKVSGVAAYHVLNADAGYNPKIVNTPGTAGGTPENEPYFLNVLTGTANQGKVNVANVGFAYNFKPQWTYTLSYYNVDQKEGVKVGKVDSYITHLQYDMNKFVSLYGIVDYQKAKEGLKTTAAGASGDQLAFTAGVRVMFDASKSF
ncbi:porin [Polynucleobacter sp. MWH-Loch1C5]|uniref:porin n=1 Tax=Polynucleobacter sp. MWH-Loch1C5 TaxID=2689108 RepID=UPI001C0BF5A8|nr:porin [Polynucleobacter sp. MWH-Loch1C5]MBU3541952.1 porin [Polynucleobacter sp. MWH-Loch1C5]